MAHLLRVRGRHRSEIPHVRSHSWRAVDDLAAAIETLTISPRHIEEAADTLARAVAEASGILISLSDGCRQQIGDHLHQAPDQQTMRMASAVIADAFLCQTAIAEGCSTPNIDATRSRGKSRILNKRHVLDVWHEILTVNYYPIFSLASRCAPPRCPTTRLARCATGWQPRPKTSRRPEPSRCRTWPARCSDA